MEAYECLYSDPKSPLTPLATMDGFTFPCKTPVNTKQLTPNYRTPVPVPVPVPVPRVTCRNATPTHRSNGVQSKTSIKPASNGQQLDCPERVIARKNYKVDNVIGKYHLSPYYDNSEKAKNPSNSKCQARKERKFYKTASPIARKKICPIMERILIELGLDYFTPLFEEQEIDFEIFQTLKKDDLRQIGITRKTEMDAILSAVHYAQSCY